MCLCPFQAIVWSVVAVTLGGGGGGGKRDVPPLEPLGNLPHFSLYLVTWDDISTKIIIIYRELHTHAHTYTHTRVHASTSAHASIVSGEKRNLEMMIANLETSLVNVSDGNKTIVLGVIVSTGQKSLAACQPLDA